MKKIQKWIKQYRGAAVLLGLGVLTLIIHGSFAAYTSFNSVKRVVSTGTQSDTMFGSNYLSLLNLSDTNYPVKRISLSDDMNCTFTVLVGNYVWGDESLYNPKDITYTVTAKLLSMDGGDLSADYSSIKINGTPFGDVGELTSKNQKLPTGKAATNEYKFEIPGILKDKVKIQIVAEPDASSKEAVNNQKLAAILSFSGYEAVKNWTGHFLDSKNKNPDQYDAFNYEISGNGSGSVTVVWEDSLQLSKWTTGGKQVNNSYTFTVDGSTTAVQFQFYRNPEKVSDLDGKDWKGLEELVKVSFTEKVDGNND